MTLRNAARQFYKKIKLNVLSTTVSLFHTWNYGKKTLVLTTSSKIIQLHQTCRSVLCFVLNLVATVCFVEGETDTFFKGNEYSCTQLKSAIVFTSMGTKNGTRKHILLPNVSMISLLDFSFSFFFKTLRCACLYVVVRKHNL